MFHIELYRSTLNTVHMQGTRDRDVQDRRFYRRYPLRLTLAFLPIFKKRSGVQAGFGSTVDISRTAVLFHCDQVIPLGTRLKLLINLPGAEENATRRLMAEGSVIRSAGQTVAVRFVNCRFDVVMKSDPMEQLVKRKIDDNNEVSACCIVCLQNAGASSAIATLLQQRSYKVSQQDLENAYSLVKGSCETIRFIVTDRPDIFSGLNIPILGVNVHAHDSEALAFQPKAMVCLKPGYTLRELMNAIDVITARCSAAAAG
jgi:hypothetical protein